MTTVSNLENKLVELLDKKAPVSLPKDARKQLAGALWWVTLIIGILQLLAVFALWQAGHVTDRWVDYANDLAHTYGVPTVAVHHLGMFYYLSVLTMGVVAVLLLIATPSLKNMQKKGWNLFFYATLFEAGVAVIRLFSNVSGGIGGFIGAAIGAILGAYFLFQVRDYFTGKKMAETVPAHDHEDKAADNTKDTKEDKEEE